MTEVNKGQLATHLGVKAPMITKHVKAGTLDNCFTPDGKKLYLEKAVKAITLGKKRDYRKITETITPTNIQDDKEIYNNETKDELEVLLETAQSSSQKVQIIKDFWVGKINKQKFMVEDSQLLSVADAKAAIESVFTPINAKLDELPIMLKSHFNEVSLEAMRWLADEINQIKIDSQSAEFD